MNSFVMKFLLGRGIGPVTEMLSKAVRHGLTTLGGGLIASGYATDSDIATLQGAGAVLVGIGLSVARTFLAKYVK